MKPGEEYEQFVFEGMSAFFRGAEVVKNDTIRGKESGILREIDISIRMSVDSLEILYVVQCKDRKKRPADINVLGEFSSVIRDVGAAKGFVFCTSGFAKTNHRYAQSLGIELFTLEDIESDRWGVSVEIPVVFIRKSMGYEVAPEFTVDAALAAAAERMQGADVEIRLEPGTDVSRDGGRTERSLERELLEMLADSANPKTSGTLDLAAHAPIYISIMDVWTRCPSLTFTYWIKPRRYLRYVTPDEWTHLSDHVRGTTLPLKMKIGSLPIDPDDGFVEIPADQENPVSSNLSIEIEEQIELERIVADAGRVGLRQAGST